MKAISRFYFIAKNSLQESTGRLLKAFNCTCSNENRDIKQYRRTRVQKLVGVSAYYKCKSCSGEIVVKTQKSVF